MRKLARIERVKSIGPIEGADRIEKATVLGWQMVCKKGEFKEGDLCIFFEIDSILPEHEVFEFMRNKKFRVKTCKFRGQVSQGLILPILLLKQFTKKEIQLEEGLDVTDIIGVKKYEPQEKPVKLPRNKNKLFSALMKYKLFRYIYKKFIYREPTKDFPTHLVSKTDEERIQNVPSVLNNDIMCTITEKIDGQSATFILNKRKFYVCSRNKWLVKEDDSTWWTIAKELDIKKKLKKLKMNIAIQGEIIGPKIQKNKYNRDKLEFYVFSAYDIDKRKYYGFLEMAYLCYYLDLKHVPLIGWENLSEFDMDSIIEYSKRDSILYDTIAEGIVVRNNNKKISFKTINPDFLISHNE